MSYQVIIVPYRNRQAHLDRFLDHMRTYMPAMPICIVEQVDDKPFNRAKLLNIGAIEHAAGHYIMHDVDMLPVDCKYDPALYAEVIQFAKSKIQLKDYLGGVTMFSHRAFCEVGGYNNEYFHRAEDNEMMFNLKRLRIPVFEEHKNFTELPHRRNKNEFNAALWYKAQQKRSQQNQLLCCEYKLVSKIYTNRVTHLVVEL
jgi:hypothetical protein